MPDRLRWLSSRRFAAAVLFTLIVGGVATSVWLASSDPAALRSSLAESRWWLLPALPALTLANLLLRFLRWAFFLRRIRTYVPLRDNLRIFLAGFSMILTPLYLGEAAKALWLRRRTGAPLRQPLAVVVSERVFDMIALAAIAAVAAGLRPLPVLVALLGLPTLGHLLAPRIRARIEASAEEDDSWRALLAGILFRTALHLRPASFAPGMALSLAAWLAACITLTLAVSIAGGPLAVRETVATFAVATPLGSLTLMPGGVGVTGTLMLTRLETALALPHANAVLAVILTRGATFWLAAVIGAGFLVTLGRRHALRTGRDQAGHFDDIAARYAEQIPDHVRTHVVGKKVARTVARLPGARLRGVDLGCGQGWYLEALRRRGHRVVGVDRSLPQLVAARGNSATAPLVAAEAGRLPFRSATLDFAYSVNVLHHITDPEEQTAALGELVRVLSPGGRLLVHEINVTNPLFRFYMGYVFPLLNDIDLGDERWLLPGVLPRIEGTSLESIEYFTFLPDFLPRPIFRALLPLERRLERSRWRAWSAHYMAVYRKVGEEAARTGRPVP